MSTLEKLPEELHAHPLMTPAIIVIGEVCALADQFEWYEKLPLSGKKIIVTRPRERQEELSQRLRSLGAEVLELPTISIAPYRAEELPEQGAALEELESYQYLVFTSPSGVDCFLHCCGKKDGYPPVLCRKDCGNRSRHSQPSAELRTDGRSDAGDL